MDIILELEKLQIDLTGENAKTLLTELAEKAKIESIESALYLDEAIDLIDNENIVEIHGIINELIYFLKERKLYQK